MTSNAVRGGAQCLEVELGDDGVNERLDDHTQ
jgi:hypothetical protein